MSPQIDLTCIAPKRIEPLSGFSGTRSNGETLSFTNYYMQINGQPFFGVCGEIHFSRLWQNRWEDALLKMKAGGVNVVSTYVFWNHHEEREGTFDFANRRNLRRFISLCQKHRLYAIVRIGPFCHGEARNGGLPDWLYGKPFEVRTTNDGFLHSVRLWYRAVAKQLNGLFYKDGGPVIAMQLDNEYMHSAAPWEMTSGSTNEWIPAGEEGDAYLLRLLSVAQEEGIDAPFYTCTGWGSAATPDAMMTLWGGYAYRPWLFYAGGGEHPATGEYLYRDNHNNAVPDTYNFEPRYAPESRPYLCCEMGGGMFCSYYYRFQLPYESVDAMTNIKIGSGCNMLGYYMYHGGTHPTGRDGMFLNEGQVPKLTYDFQAALGEFGQVRPSYRRLKALHLFAKTFGRELCRMKTVLPEGSQSIQPTDTHTLRYAVRVDEHGAGFLFLNNFQDHAPMADKLDQTVMLRLPQGDIVFDGLSLAAGENCVLPFHLPIGGVELIRAHAQPLAVLDIGGEPCAFFFTPEGMYPVYVFAENTTIVTDVGNVSSNGGQVCVTDDLPHFTATQDGHTARFITLTRAQSLLFTPISFGGHTVAMLTEAALLPTERHLCAETDQPEWTVSVYPDNVLPLHGAVRQGMNGVFTRYRLHREPCTLTVACTQVGPSRYTLRIPPWSAADAKDVLLELDYSGDTAQLFLQNRLIADHFHNGAVWQIGLAEFRRQLAENTLTLLITPVKQGSAVNVQSAMAGRKEEVAQANGALHSATLKPVYEWKLC